VAGETKGMRAVVRGRVQGVGFRDYVEMRASTLGLCGYVRNQADGSVEVMAEGSEDALGQLLQRLREGPRSARVDEVAVEWVQPTGAYVGFRTAF
jgi:acylphosphatase